MPGSEDRHTNQRGTENRGTGNRGRVGTGQLQRRTEPATPSSDARLRRILRLVHEKVRRKEQIPYSVDLINKTLSQAAIISSANPPDLSGALIRISIIKLWLSQRVADRNVREKYMGTSEYYQIDIIISYFITGPINDAERSLLTAQRANIHVNERKWDEILFMFGRGNNHLRQLNNELPLPPKVSFNISVRNIVISQLRKARRLFIIYLEEIKRDSPEWLKPLIGICIEIIKVVTEIFVRLLIAIFGIITGIISGIIGLFQGLIGLILLLIRLIIILINLPFDDPESRAIVEENVEAFKQIPGNLKKFIDDWGTRFDQATPDQQIFMIGEVTGEILVQLATLGAGTGARAGKIGTFTFRPIRLPSPALVRSTGSIPAAAAEATKGISISLHGGPELAAAATLTMSVTERGRQIESQGGRGRGTPSSEYRRLSREFGEARPRGGETGLQYERRILSIYKRLKSISRSFFFYTSGGRGNIRFFIERLKRHLSRYGQRHIKFKKEILEETSQNYFHRKGWADDWNEIYLDKSKEALKTRTKISELPRGRDSRELKVELERKLARLDNDIEEMDKFARGKVGNKQPDLVEVFIEDGKIVVTDITLDPNNIFHNFKTKFYVEVIRDVIEWGDEALEVFGIDWKTAREAKIIE